MKAALCTSLDGISAVHVTDVPEPDWAGGDIVVRVRCVGLNHSDVLRSQGRYQDKADLPFSPGGEIAGIVERASALSGFHVGQRVMAYVGHGGARERIAVPPERLVAIPDAVADEVAAGVPITYGTALHAFRDRTVIEPGETIAILGAGGGAGLAAIEVGKLLGAHVLAVASRDKHVACLDLGADAASQVGAGAAPKSSPPKSAQPKPQPAGGGSQVSGQNRPGGPPNGLRKTSR